VPTTQRWPAQTSSQVYGNVEPSGHVYTRLLQVAGTGGGGSFAGGCTEHIVEQSS
jgi:hypothetical protein